MTNDQSLTQLRPVEAGPWGLHDGGAPRVQTPGSSFLIIDYWVLIIDCWLLINDYAGPMSPLPGGHRASLDDGGGFVHV